MKLKRILCVALCLAVMAGAISGCSKPQETQIETEKLTVSEVTHSIFYAPMYAAINMGYFEENHLEIELVNAGGADKVMTSLLTDAADIGFAGPEAVIYVYAQGKTDYPKVFAQLTQRDGSFLVGREKADGFKWTDLKGSTILPGRKGGIPYMTLLYCLNKNGIEVGKDVFFDDSIQFNAMTGAFVSGTGDYVTVFEPGATALEAEGKGYILASVGEEGGLVPYTTYFANPEFISEKPQTIQNFVNAIYNPDYAVRGIYHSTGDYNDSPIVDAKVDEIIDLGATQTATQSIATYKQLEDYLVTQQAYIVPLYARMSIIAINNKVLDEASIIVGKAVGTSWADYTYVDTSLNATRPMVLTQTNAVMTSFDPIQANDAASGSFLKNCNVRLVNLTTENDITTDESLSRSFATAQGNSEYYFLLRDDVYYSKVENKQAVNTGVRAGAEDVVYALERASNKDSVPAHKTYTLHNHMKSIEIITDLADLDGVVDSDTGKPILETLTDGLDAPLKTLTADKTKADNANGTYQLVKITTTQPFPQVLNFLAHSSAGIVCKEAVEAMNSKFEVAKYDPTKDVGYGDFNAVKSGNNHLWQSGPYVLVSVDDYGGTFVKNPGFMTGTDGEAKIANVYMKFIKDTSSATSAFRAGEVDMLSSVATNDVATLEQSADITIKKRTQLNIFEGTFNLREGSKFLDSDLRHAVLYAINQDDFLAYNNNLVNKGYSSITAIIESDNVLVQDLNKSAEYLAKYQAKAAK